MPDKKNKKLGIHENLKGFDISINEFGQLESSFPLDRINDFLNEEIKDKKFTKEIYRQFEEE